MLKISSFRIFSESLVVFIELFCQILQLQLFNLCEVMRTSVKALKEKKRCLEVVASSSLMLCRSKNPEKKRKSELY